MKTTNLGNKILVGFYDDGVRTFENWNVDGIATYSKYIEYDEYGNITNSIFIEYDDLKIYYLNYAYEYLVRNKVAYLENFINECMGYYFFTFEEMMKKRKKGKFDKLQYDQFCIFIFLMLNDDTNKTDEVFKYLENLMKNKMK